MRDDVIEIRSKLSQSRRSKATDLFRKARSAVMMTSDVTARGVDFDDVTLVVQMSVPSNREQYIARLGRQGVPHNPARATLVLSREEVFRREGHRGPAALGDLRPRVAGATRARSPPRWRA